MGSCGGSSFPNDPGFVATTFPSMVRICAHVPGGRSACAERALPFPERKFGEEQIRLLRRRELVVDALEKIVLGLVVGEHAGHDETDGGEREEPEQQTRAKRHEISPRGVSAACSPRP